MASHFRNLAISGRSHAIAWSVVGAVGLTEAVVLLVAPKAWWPKCPVHAATGVLCPGCGGQRAVQALMGGHLGLALRCDALLFAVPLFLLSLHWTKGTSWEAAGRRTLLIVGAVCVIGFTVLRNLPGSGLAPPG